jgi:hypothetical protein
VVGATWRDAMLSRGAAKRAYSQLFDMLRPYNWPSQPSVVQTSAEILETVRESAVATIASGTSDENLPVCGVLHTAMCTHSTADGLPLAGEQVRTAAVRAVAALALACLQHGGNAERPMKQLTKLLADPVTEVRYPL